MTDYCAQGVIYWSFELVWSLLYLFKTRDLLIRFAATNFQVAQPLYFIPLILQIGAIICIISILLGLDYIRIPQSSIFGSNWRLLSLRVLHSILGTIKFQFLGADNLIHIVFRNRFYRTLLEPRLVFVTLNTLSNLIGS